MRHESATHPGLSILCTLAVLLGAGCGASGGDGGGSDGAQNLELSVVGEEFGRVDRDDGFFESTLTAVPTEEGEFLGFEVDGSPVAGTVIVVDTSSSVEVVATFRVRQATLSVQVTGAGNGSLSVGGGGLAIDCPPDCELVLDLGTVVTIEPSADPGSEFTGWTNCGDDLDRCTLTMKDDTTVVGVFQPPASVTLTVQTDVGSGQGTVSSQQGIDCGSDCSETVARDTVIVLTAQPDADSSFESWTGCTNTSGTSCTVTMDSSRLVTANFQLIPQVELSVSKLGTGEGSVSGSGIDCGSTCSVSVLAGTVITLQAMPSSGSSFQGWTGCGSTTASPSCTLTVDASTALTVVFNELPDATLTVAKLGTGSGTVVGSGVDCGADCTVTVPAGTSVNLQASPSEGSLFDGWTGCADNQSLTCTVVVGSNQTVTATFSTVPRFTLSVVKAGDGEGTVTGGGINCGSGLTCQVTVDEGTTIDLVADAHQDSRFDGWVGCSSEPGGNCRVVVDENMVVTASFELIPEFSLTVEKQGSGDGVVSGGEIDCGSQCFDFVREGEIVTLSALPDADSSFDGFIGCTSSDGSSCEVSMTRDRIVTAVFRARPVASFSASQIGTTFEVRFSSTSSSESPIAKLEWDPGDGSGFTEGGSVFNYSYDRPGSFTVELRITNEEGEIDDTSQTVNVDWTLDAQPGDRAKQLDFEWTPVTSPSLAFYELLVEPDGSSGFRGVDVDGDGQVDAGDRISSTTPFASILLPIASTDFDRIRFQLVARAAGGSEIGRSSERFLFDVDSAALVGYFKASNPDPNDFFQAVALSEDGATMAVGAFSEDSRANTIDGSQGNGGNFNGAVYVFRRDGQGGWEQQAYIKPGNNSDRMSFGSAVALSADGETLAVGSPGESSTAFGVNPTVTDGFNSGSGAAYVFVRNGSSWSQQAFIKAPQAAPFTNNQGDAFGTSVSLSRSGDGLAVGAPLEDSNASGIDSPDLGNNAREDSGAAYVYERIGSTWSLDATFKATTPGSGDEFGTDLSLNAAGTRLLVGAPGEDSLDGSEADNSGDDAGAAYLFKENNGRWNQAFYLKPETIVDEATFGFSVSMASTTRHVVGAPGEFTTQIGAVYVFNEQFELARLAPEEGSERDLFGADVGISRDGQRIVVGATFEDGSGRGVSPDVDDDESGAGAAYLFEAVTPSSWLQRNYLKSPNTFSFQRFGGDVAISGDGSQVAVGGGDDGGGTGVNPPFDQAVPGSGAVFLY